MRTLSGPEQFTEIKKTVVDSYSKLFPVTNTSGFKLELKNIWVDEAGLDSQDFTSQKKARLSGNTYGAPVYAALELKDPNGKIIDRMDKIRFATIPQLTTRGSYIVGGNEYQVNHQLRRKPGVYVVKMATGDQYKANFTLTGEGSKNFELHFDPVSNKYSVTKIGGSSSELPLYPLLHTLGVSDQELQRTWGTEVLAANKKTSPRDIIKYAKHMTGQTTDSAETAADHIKTWVKGMILDPHTTEVTLGKSHPTLTSSTIVDTSKKLLGVYQGKIQPDDPESLLFKEVLSVDNMLADKLQSKRQISAMQYMLSRHLGKRMKIADLIDRKKLTSPVESFFTHDNRSSTPEQYNPLQMLSNEYKLTIKGVGGIQDPHTIATEIREVHPTHVGFIDAVHTPESSVGVTMHLTSATRKEGREILSQVFNTKTGKMEFLSPKDLYRHTVAFPDGIIFDGAKPKYQTQEIKAQRLGKMIVVKPYEVNYIFPTAAQLFSPSTNMIPFLHNDQGNRVMMGAKMLEQAIPLVDREAPLVQTAVTNDKTFQQVVGEQIAVKAPLAGKVTATHPDYIEIDKKTRVSIYNNFPLNQKTFIHHSASVKVGDTVKKGQIIAESNFDKKGVLALGKNLNVAYLAYPGLTFEDGIVITESAAKKLATQQMYRSTFEVSPKKHESNLRRFMSYYGNAVEYKKLSDYDADGVIKKGTIVQPGQVTIMGMHYNLANPENATLKRINRSLQLPWSNSSTRYTGEFAGIVTDVVKRADKIEVFVKAEEPARESDKLSGTHGNKGVITRVIPDNEAPRTKDGKIPDILLNPHGIIGRINIGQIYESAASKIAEKTGKPYVVHNFNGEDTSKKITEEMKAHGVDDREEMFLPNGKSLGKVSFGKPYILRLSKTGKSGFSARMPGTGYDINMQPTKGGEEGTKSLDLLTFYSMLSHGAKKNLIDAHQKSEKNDEYWHAIETGKPIPAPKPTFVWNKFMSLLHGAGINPDKKGSEITLAPMTDTDVKKLSKGAITEAEFLHGKDLKERKGGFFDPVITGGLHGQNYAHLELHEALPNPIFESAIRSLTNLTGPQYESIINGTKHVDKNGALTASPGTETVTGGAGINRILSGIDLDKELTVTKAKLKIAREGDLNRLNKRVRYLTALKDLNLRPEQAYMRKLLPIVPPIYRPIYDMPNRGLQVAPANILYQNTSILNKSAQLPVMKLLSHEDKSELHEDLYSSTRAVAGLEPVIQKGREATPIEGFISQISSDRPKSGFFLEKVISKRQDLVGRGVVTNAPDLHVDELGVPEKMAWKLFRPFAIREFGLSGINTMQARKEMDEQTPRAKEMLQSAMNKRTILMNRAPSLHKFSIQAFKPKLSDGLAVRVPPLVMKGFNMDVDGDAVQLHVPVSEEAVRESYKMMPSQNLFKPGSGELLIQPSQESAIGLYFLSRTSEGIKQINALLPEKFHISSELDSKNAKTLYNRIAKEDKQAFAKLVTNLKLLGDKVAYERGFSTGVKDVAINRKARDQIFSVADKEVAVIRRTSKPGVETDQKVADIYQKAAKSSYQALKRDIGKTDNSFYHMVTSGARGKDNQLMQMLSAPGILEDAKGRAIPVPVKKSYAEGLSTSDFFTAAYGVRKGMMDRALATSQPGALNKDIMASTIDNVITETDCGVHKGVTLPIVSRDVHERYLAKDQHGFSRNTLMTPQIVSQMQKKGIQQIEVRSPLNCVAKKGTCAHCFGIDENGTLPMLGDNIGAKSGQTMSEPLTQSVMKTFHSGGVAGGPAVAVGFERVQQLLRMPAYVAGEASLANATGKVTQIKKTPAGGHEVYIGEHVHAVRPGLPLNIKVGDTVKAGDAISAGVIKPQNLVQHKGMAGAQNYIVDELQKAYDSQGIPMQRRIFETVVRSIGNMTRVEHAPKHADFIPGDLIPYTTAIHYNETRAKTLPVNDALGYHLKASVGKLPQFHQLGDKDVAYIKGLGYNNIDVLKEPIVHAPILKGIERLPLEKRNWMAQLGYRYIKETLTEGASQAWKSNVEGTHPIPAFAYGVKFGEKKEHY